jgi:hypothetical protein
MVEGFSHTLLCHTPLQVCVHRCGLHSQPGTLSFTFYPAMPGNSTTLPREKWDNQRPVMAASMGQTLADRAFEGASRWVLVLVCVICCAGLCWVLLGCDGGWQSPVWCRVLQEAGTAAGGWFKSTTSIPCGQVVCCCWLAGWNAPWSLLQTLCFERACQGSTCSR